MIRFTLRCTHAHEFEGWFRDNAAYEKQAAANLLSCPTCGDNVISKAIMAPAIARTDRARPSEATMPAAAMPTPEITPPAGGNPHAAKLAILLRAVREHVEKNFEDVGERFPEEARRIHYGEADPKGIYGEATRDEVEALLDEGIEINPLPLLPKLTS